MRLSLLLCAAFLLFAGAAEASSVPRGSPIFSTGSCSHGLTCPAEADYSADPNYLSRLTSLANSCIAQNFVLKDKGPAIEETYGLDGENCFTTKPMTKEKVGLTMTPVCCVVPDSSGSKCQISCTLYGVR